MKIKYTILIYVALMEILYITCQNGGKEYLTINEEGDYGLDATHTAYNGYTEGSSDASGKWWPANRGTSTYYPSGNNDWMDCNKHYFTTEHFYVATWPNNRDIRRQVTLDYASYKIKVVMKMVIYALSRWNGGKVTINASAGAATYSMTYTLSSATYDGQDYCEDYHSMYLADSGRWDYFLDTSFELDGISGTTVSIVIEAVDTNYIEASYQNWYGITQFNLYEYQCDDACETCDGIEIIDCLTCPSGKFRYYTYTDGSSVKHYRCYTNCPVGYYEDSSGAIDECTICHSRCVDCFDATYDDCTSCDTSNYYLDGNSCLLTCTNNCYTCQNTPTENSSFCLSCDYPYFLDGNNCGLTCPAGKYKNMSTYTCDTCPVECATCTDLNTCQSCQAGFYHYSWDSKCVTDCPDNYYEDGGTNKCEYCDNNCRTCQTTAANCQSCLDNEFLDGSTCQTCESVAGFITDPSFKGTVTDVSQCLEICGDGKRYGTDHECDDGNNLDGDGCNSQCQIETGWACSGGSSFVPDSCSDNNPVRYIISQEQQSYYFENLEENETIKYVIKFDQSFSVSSSTLQQMLQVKIDDVDSSDFQYTLQKSDTDSLIYHIFIDPVVNIENKNVTFTFSNPEYVVDYAGNQMIDKTTDYLIEQYAYYPSSKRNSIANLQTFLYVLLVLICISIVPNMILQKFYVTSIAIDHMQLALLLGLVEIKQTLNGVKQVQALQNMFSFFANFQTDTFENDNKKTQVPDNYQYYGYSQLILDNGQGVFFYLLLLLIFYCIAKIAHVLINKKTYFKSNYYDSEIRLWSQKILFGFFEWAAFNDFWQCACTVFGVFCMVNYYALDWNTSSILSIFFGFCVLFTPPSIFMISQINKNDPYKHQDNGRDDYEQISYKFGYKFRNFWVWLNLDRQHNIFYLFVFFLRKVLYVFIFVGLSGWVKLQIYLVVGINSVYLLYFIIKRPYLRAMDNLRAFATEIIMFFALFLTVAVDDESLNLDEIYNKNQKFIICILVCAIIHAAYILIDILYLSILLPLFKYFFNKKSYRVSNLRDIRQEKDLSKDKIENENDNENDNENEYDDILSNSKINSGPRQKQFQNKPQNRYGINLGDEMDSIDDVNSMRSGKLIPNSHFTINNVNIDNIGTNLNSQTSIANDFTSVRQTRVRRNNGKSTKAVI